MEENNLNQIREILHPDDAPELDDYTLERIPADASEISEQSEEYLKLREKLLKDREKRIRERQNQETLEEQIQKRKSTDKDRDPEEQIATAQDEARSDILGLLGSGLAAGLGNVLVGGLTMFAAMKINKNLGAKLGLRWIQRIAFKFFLKNRISKALVRIFAEVIGKAFKAASRGLVKIITKIVPRGAEILGKFASKAGKLAKILGNVGKMALPVVGAALGFADASEREKAGFKSTAALERLMAASELGAAALTTAFPPAAPILAIMGTLGTTFDVVLLGADIAELVGNPAPKRDIEAWASKIPHIDKIPSEEKFRSMVNTDPRTQLQNTNPTRGRAIHNQAINEFANGHLKFKQERKQTGGSIGGTPTLNTPTGMDLIAQATEPVKVPPDAVIDPRTTDDTKGKKKTEDKKAETKKPEAKKPEAKKPETKKPEAKKPEDKKPETKKPEDKKPESSPTAGMTFNNPFDFMAKVAGNIAKSVGSVLGPLTEFIKYSTGIDLMNFGTPSLDFGSSDSGDSSDSSGSSGSSGAGVDESKVSASGADKKAAAFLSTLEASGPQNVADVYQVILNRTATKHNGAKTMMQVITAREQFSPYSSAIFGTSEDSAAASRFGDKKLTVAKLAEMAGASDGLARLQRFFKNGDASTAARILQDFNSGGSLSKEAKRWVGARKYFTAYKRNSDDIKRGPGGNWFSHRFKEGGLADTMPKTNTSSRQSPRKNTSQIIMMPVPVPSGGGGGSAPAASNVHSTITNIDTTAKLMYANIEDQRGAEYLYNLRVLRSI